MRNYFTIFLCFFITAAYINTQTFEDVFPKMGIEFFAHDDFLMSGGAVVIDYNGDGWDDILLLGGDDEPSKLYKNNPNSSGYKDKFIDVTVDAGLDYPSKIHVLGGGVFDYNRDGWQDLFLTTNKGQSNMVYRNNGDGTFTDVTKELGLDPYTEMSASVTFGDVNLDGWIDIYVANYFESDYQGSNCVANHLFINDEGQSFYEEAATYGVDDLGCGLAVTFSDYDNDGDMDIFVANDFGQNFSSNALYRNEYPEKKFTNVKNQTGFNAAIFGMGVGPGDFDNDGDMDYYVTNIGKNPFYENQSNHEFIEKSKEYKIDNTKVNPDDNNSGLTVGWGINWFDYDHDMYLDLHVTNGFLAPEPHLNTEVADKNKLFRNNGPGKVFTDIGDDEGIASIGIDRGSVQLDFDNDGDMDILSSVCRPDDSDPQYNKDDYFSLFENKQQLGRNWLKVKLVGSMTSTLAKGSKVKAHVGEITMMREVTGGGGTYLSHSTLIQHFGLMDNEIVDSVEVIWPGAKWKSLVRNVKANQTIEIIEPYFDTLHTDVCKGEEIYGQIWEEDGFIEREYTANNGADSNVVFDVKVFDPVEEEINVELCKGEEFLDKEWNSSGEIVKEFETYKGCDSIITYNVEVKQNVVSTVDTSICPADFYEGKQYIEDTIITKEFESYIGCDSIVKINIDILDAPTYTENFEVCFGEFFKGEIIVEKTIFSEKFESGEGCDSVHSIVVEPIPLARNNDTVRLEEGGTFKGRQYFENAVYEETFENGAENGCDSIYTVFIRIEGPDNVYYSIVDNNQFNLKAVPNPFNNNTEISFEIDKPSLVRLEILNQIGKTVGVLINNEIKSGYNEVKLTEDKNRITSGIYYLKMTVGSKVFIKKLIKTN